MLEAVRDRSSTIDLPQVNRVLMQPHLSSSRMRDYDMTSWRAERDVQAS